MVLVVDDDSELLERAEHILQQDQQVFFARNGAHAWTLINVIGFSIALVDLDLPDCNGFQLIEEIHLARPTLPIVAISGVFSGSVLESAKEFGAVEVLSKPPDSQWKAAVDRLRIKRVN